MLSTVSFAQGIGGHAGFGGHSGRGGGLIVTASAPTFVQDTTNATGTGSTGICSGVSACVAGSITTTSNDGLMAVVFYQGSTTVTSITDSKGNTWSGPDCTDASEALKVFHAVVTSAGATNVQVNYGTPTGNQLIYVAEVSGINTSTPVDTNACAHSSAPGSGTNAITMGASAITTTKTNDLITAFVGNNAGEGAAETFTAGTSPLIYALQKHGNDGGNWTFAGEDAVAASSGATTATWTSNKGTDFYGIGALAWEHP